MDETSTAERLKSNLASGNTRPGFLILIVMMIGAALGLLLLNTYQQNIRTRPPQRLPAEPVVLPGIEPFRPASD